MAVPIPGFPVIVPDLASTTIRSSTATLTSRVFKVSKVVTNGDLKCGRRCQWLHIGSYEQQDSHTT